MANQSIQRISNDFDTDDGLEIPYLSLLSKIQKWIGEGSGWFFESVNGGYENIYI